MVSQLSLPPLLRVVLLAAAASTLIGADAPAGQDRLRWAQLTIHERLIIRIPRIASSTSAVAGPANLSRPLPLPHWIERVAPKCVAAATLTSAQVGAADAIDLIVSGTRRLRAKLEEKCPTLDFYSGFYLKPASDGNVCAGRDVIRSRSGAHCAIREFKTLVAKR